MTEKSSRVFSDRDEGSEIESLSMREAYAKFTPEQIG
jgi:hypothetical protein